MLVGSLGQVPGRQVLEPLPLVESRERGGQQGQPVPQGRSARWERELLELAYENK